MDKTTYKPIAGFLGYRVGTDGSIWTCWDKHGRHKATVGTVWKKLRPGGTRHAVVTLTIDGKPHYRRLHILILETFVGPCPEGMECCHNDGNGFNNKLSNLRWDTKESNYNDRRKHGTSNDGVANGRAKLTESLVLEIRNRLKKGEKQVPLSRYYGVSQLLISKIKRGELWRTKESGYEAASV